MTKRILIADDEPNVRQLLELVLRGQGYDVTLATNGGQLVRLAQERVPDLVLVDLMMPQLDGYEAIRQLRNEIQRAVAMSAPGGAIDPEHLSADLAAPPTPSGATMVSARASAPRNLASAIEEVERDLITQTLDRTSGNISETARVLGLTRRGLYLKMRRLGLESVSAD